MSDNLLVKYSGWIWFDKSWRSDSFVTPARATNYKISHVIPIKKYEAFFHYYYTWKYKKSSTTSIFSK